MKAIFFDRDGVLTKPVYRSQINRYSAAYTPEELEVYDLTSLRKLALTKSAQYLLFLISNQPDATRGCTSMENLLKTHEKFDKILQANNIYFEQYYYCYHSSGCLCRKPSPYFIIQAAKEYDLDLSKSYMIGDRDTDMLCGQSMGLNTIKVTIDIYSGTNNIDKAMELIE